MSEARGLVDELKQVLARLKDVAGQSRSTTVMGRRVGISDSSKLSQCLNKVDEILSQYFEEEEAESAYGETLIQVYPEIYDLRSPLAWNHLRINLERTGMLPNSQVQTLIAALKATYQQEGRDE